MKCSSSLALAKRPLPLNIFRWNKISSSPIQNFRMKKQPALPPSSGNHVGGQNPTGGFSHNNVDAGRRGSSLSFAWHMYQPGTYNLNVGWNLSPGSAPGEVYAWLDSQSSQPALGAPSAASGVPMSMTFTPHPPYAVAPPSKTGSSKQSTKRSSV